jgi:hypothetical protein
MFGGLFSGLFSSPLLGAVVGGVGNSLWKILKETAVNTANTAITSTIGGLQKELTPVANNAERYVRRYLTMNPDTKRIVYYEPDEVELNPQSDEEYIEEPPLYKIRKGNNRRHRKIIYRRR